MTELLDETRKTLWQEDREDIEQMLREQIRMQQLEIQRLKRKIRELEEND